MKPMRIGELAQKARVNVDTIRYYERRGLIAEPLDGSPATASMPRMTSIESSS